MLGASPRKDRENGVKRSNLLAWATTHLRVPCAVFAVCGLSVALAAEPRTEHTYGLAEGETRPIATLADAHWLAGSWTGTAFGKHMEEIWSTPSADSMVGTFKLYDDTGVAFYELLLMTVEDGTLSLKVKHFNADFTSWEEKEDFINFKLVKLSEDELHFGGISFYRRGPDHIDGYIVMRSGETLREEKLVYRRVGSQ